MAVTNIRQLTIMKRKRDNDEHEEYEHRKARIIVTHQTRHGWIGEGEGWNVRGFLKEKANNISTGARRHFGKTVIKSYNTRSAKTSDKTRSALKRSIPMITSVRPGVRMASSGNVQDWVGRF